MPDVMEHLGLSGFWLKREPWIFLGFAVVAPLSCFKKVDALKYTSGLSVMFVCFLAFLILLYSIPGDGLDPCDTDDGVDGGDDDVCVGDKPLVSVNGDTFRVLSIYVYGLAVQPVCCLLVSRALTRIVLGGASPCHSSISPHTLLDCLADYCTDC